jgi:DDE superfamily endonuclease
MMFQVDQEMQGRRSEANNVRTFKSFFGRHPRHLARGWRDLQLAGIMTVDEAQNRDSFEGFLIANNFLRCCETVAVRCARFKYTPEKLSKCQWRFVQWLASLKDWKIKCPTEWPVKLGATCDGTHARINEPRDPDMRRNPKNYSYKHNFAGLNYQIVLATWTNRVLYANAGDPSSVHDMTAIRAEFVDMVPKGCRVIADSGYAGKTEKEKKIFAIRNHLDDDDVSLFKARARARQEQFNARLKSYKCLSGTFIHGMDRHRMCFAAVLVLLQYAIEDTSPDGEPLDTL